MVLWTAILNGLVILILQPLWARFGQWQEVVGNAYNIVAVAGAVLTAAGVSVLAIRGRLPWTAERASNRRGFSVEPRVGADK